MGRKIIALMQIVLMGMPMGTPIAMAGPYDVNTDVSNVAPGDIDPNAVPTKNMSAEGICAAVMDASRDVFGGGYAEGNKGWRQLGRDQKTEEMSGFGRWFTGAVGNAGGDSRRATRHEASDRWKNACSAREIPLDGSSGTSTAQTYTSGANQCTLQADPSGACPIRSEVCVESSWLQTNGSVSPDQWAGSGGSTGAPQTCEAARSQVNTCKFAKMAANSQIMQYCVARFQANKGKKNLQNLALIDAAAAVACALDAAKFSNIAILNKVPQTRAAGEAQSQIAKKAARCGWASMGAGAAELAGVIAVTASDMTGGQGDMRGDSTVGEGGVAKRDNTALSKMVARTAVGFAASKRMFEGFRMAKKYFACGTPQKTSFERIQEKSFSVARDFPYTPGGRVAFLFSLLSENIGISNSFAGGPYSVNIINQNWMSQGLNLGTTTPTLLPHGKGLLPNNGGLNNFSLASKPASVTTQGNGDMAGKPQTLDACTDDAVIAKSALSAALVFGALAAVRYKSLKDAKKTVEEADKAIYGLVGQQPPPSSGGSGLLGGGGSSLTGGNSGGNSGYSTPGQDGSGSGSGSGSGWGNAADNAVTAGAVDGGSVDGRMLSGPLGRSALTNAKNAGITEKKLNDMLTSGSGFGNMMNSMGASMGMGGKMGELAAFAEKASKNSSIFSEVGSYQLGSAGGSTQPAAAAPYDLGMQDQQLATATATDAMNFAGRAPAQEEDIFHTGTTMNLFEIVSRRIGANYGKVGAK